MKLIDLNPQFIGAGGAGITDADGKPVPERRGVLFSCDCPCGCGSRLHVPIENPIDGGPKRTDHSHAWLRTGETFDVLTLTPSIRRIPFDGSCGWHGFITNGSIIDCGDGTPATEEFKTRMREERIQE